MRIGFFIMTMALGATLGSAAPAVAQTSEQDLLKRFQTHQQVHRGLSLAPVASGSAASAAAGQSMNSGSSDATVTTGAAATTATAPRSQTQGQRTAAAPTATDVRYTQMPEDAQINIRIQFEYDSAVLRPSEYAKLETLCNAIKQSDVGLFRIFGHTDTSGGDRYNLNLSRLRAEEVRRHMIEKCGVEPDRLEAIGVGEQYPLTGSAPTAPENRRVEFQAIS